MPQALNLNSPVVVAAFHMALRHQALIVLVVVGLVPVAWQVWRWRAAGGSPSAAAAAEAPARHWLRLAFGGLWLLDGLLQLQQSMPLGLVPKVIEPATSSSPDWVTSLVGDFTAVWSRHPVSAAAAVVWVQLGLGVWFLAANRGTVSRLAGVASVAWSVVVWIGANAFGQIFNGGISWLTGAPGAVALYAVAGVLLALPERLWDGVHLGRWVLRASGLYLLGFALLQAWPGRGFWQGGDNGGIASAVSAAAGTPQPGWLQSVVSGFATLAGDHGWAVNLAVVVAMTVCGAGLLAVGRRRLVTGAVAATAALCVADWVLVQDLGFLGGLGTDPNSMLPFLAVVVAGWLAVRAPAASAADVASLPVSRSWRQADPRVAMRTIAAAGAVVIAAVGAVPLLIDSVRTHADPIVTSAIDGPPQAIDVPAAPFDLVDQAGHRVSLASLRGTTVALTFLDPVCTSDCPVIGIEMRQAADLLGHRPGTAFLAVDTNVRYLDPAYLQAFDTEQRLDAIPGWHFLTGEPAALSAVWHSYGAYVAETPNGGMIDHNDLVYVIGADGRLRYELDANPGPATSATQSSFAVTLANAMTTASASPR